MRSQIHAEATLPH